MDKRLHHLDTYAARGSDGRTYAVHGYEHLARLDLMADGQEHWESTGQVEYRLADGHRLHVDPDGGLRVPGSELKLRL